MGRLTEKVAELTRSRLVITLALGFALIVLVDLTFIGILSVEIMKTDRHAAREFQLIRAAQRISNLAKTVLQHRRLLDRVRWTPEASKYEHNNSVNRIRTQSRTLLKEWKMAGLPTDEVVGLTNSIGLLCQNSDAIFADGASAQDRQTAYETLISNSSALYVDSMSRMQRVHELINTEQTPQSEIDPLTLCLVAVGTNVGVCLLAGYLMVTTITAPITRLADTCKNLMVGKVFPEPTSRHPEIRQLETTFHEMSTVFAETEQSRIGFLKKMHNVQEVTLQNVKASIEQLSSTNRTKANDTIGLMKSNIEGMLYLLSSMTYGLNFSAEDDVDLVPVMTSTTELLNDTSKTVTWLMKRKKIELIVEDPGLELECDIHLIERVIVNLLSNASKYSANGAQIQLSASTLENGVRFEIRDFGCGISIENQEKLFQKFSQVEAVDGVKRAGSGLGLLICKNIVLAHGGDIGCDSAENEGSCFWFQLPLRVIEKPKTLEASPEIRHAHYGGKFTRSLILVIVLYAIGQSFLAYNLTGKFEYVKQTAATYSNRKELILETQELLTTFLTWRQKSLEAVKRGDVQSFMDMQPLLREQQDRVDRLLLKAAPNTFAYKHLNSLKTSLLLLNSLANDAMESINEYKPTTNSGEFKAADRIASNIEYSVFAILTGQRKSLDSAYDLERQLRSDISWTLIWATVVNTVILVSLCTIGLKIVSEIAELNSKALKFAFGADLDRSIEGNNELAQLDERLCDVAHKVRAAQRQRQDLMAIINHDLRTPLGAFLGGLEMFSAGMFGEVTDEEEQLLSQAESDARNVLKIIDDFLASEKQGFEDGRDNS